MCPVQPITETVFLSGSFSLLVSAAVILLAQQSTHSLCLWKQSLLVLFAYSLCVGLPVQPVDDVDAQVLGLLHHINIPRVVYPSSSF